MRAADGRCLYFTRTAAPWGEGPIERHVGIYVYRRDALARFNRKQVLKADDWMDQSLPF